MTAIIVNDCQRFASHLLTTYVLFFHKLLVTWCYIVDKWNWTLTHSRRVIQKVVFSNVSTVLWRLKTKINWKYTQKRHIQGRKNLTNITNFNRSGYNNVIRRTDKVNSPFLLLVYYWSFKFSYTFRSNLPYRLEWNDLYIDTNSSQLCSSRNNQGYLPEL